MAFSNRSALSCPTTGAPSRMTTESNGDTYSDAYLFVLVQVCQRV